MVVNTSLFSHTDHDLDQSDRQSERNDISIGRSAGEGEGEELSGGVVDIPLQAEETPRGANEEAVKGTRASTPSNGPSFPQPVVLRTACCGA